MRRAYARVTYNSITDLFPKIKGNGAE
jgi:hypothetical protein